MKHFSIEEIVRAYNGCCSTTTNKFWGLLAILNAIDSQVRPCVSYSFQVSSVSNTLDRIFSFSQSKEYSQSTQWGVMLSKHWVEYVSKELLKSSPNIFDVIIWFYHDKGFESELSNQELIARFLEDTHLSIDVAKQLFSFTSKNIDYTETYPSSGNLLMELCKVTEDSKGNRTITMDKNFVVASPGELSRAPFVQPLYAGQGIQECLILTQFNFSELYTNDHSSQLSKNETVSTSFASYIAALRTKPFMLLAGISGTGKSRIVREMAKACWVEGEEDFGKNRPKNFCMVQVKPNWHDSSELIGYISRINGEKFVVGPFLKFMARAIQDPSKPYFLCLDEMNLAPVEQYFAEYLSVIESRKVDDAGNIVTDPLIDYEDTEAYKTLIDQLFDDDDDRKAYLTKERGRRLTIPQNLFVIGTVNMDETTYSFSRKVLDRAMTIEMNEVNLDGGLDKDGAHEFTFIPTSAIVGKTVEGCDVYSNNSTLCDFVIKYLTKINAKLDGTPFKIAYRTRNEFLVYAVNRLLIAGDELSAEDKNRLVLSALDEMTSMKILSRIEGDETRTRTVLRELHTLLEDELKAKGIDSMSLLKIDEMLKKLDDTQYTSYWA